jgi:recombination protein RecA
MKIGVQWGDPTTTTGGNALKFYASVRLQISRVGTIKTGAGDKEESVGNRTRVKVVKNKVAPPFREVEFDIIFGKGISYFGDIIELGLTLGMIEKSGSWYSYRGEKIGQGVSKAADYLQANPAVAELLDSAIRKHYGIKDSVDATQ